MADFTYQHIIQFFVVVVFVVFHLQVFHGNTDENSIVKHSLSPDVQARFVRFYPVTFHAWPCLRVEIFVLM